MFSDFRVAVNVVCLSLYSMCSEDDEVHKYFISGGSGYDKKMFNIDLKLASSFFLSHTLVSEQAIPFPMIVLARNHFGVG